MPSIQDTIYPRIKNNLSDQDLEEAYTPLHSEIQWTERKSRGNVQQLGLLVLIKVAQKLGFFPQFLDIPQPIVHHIANKAFLPIPTMEMWNAYGESRTYERHYHFVRDYLKIHPFDEQARQIIFDVIKELSSSKDDCADLINAAIEELIHQRYELPVYNTLKDMANKVRRKSYHLIYEQVFNTLSTELSLLELFCACFK
ncbi:DUF4158 domain-containing protein [Bacillus cereus]|uniref:DUF4158 domain-containing protein n=1 Tax=Bacillus cereus TaxID=1396 RepID=UPI0035CBC89A